MASGQEEKDFVILRTYALVWNTPFKIYSIENIKLLFPINPWELLYFMVGVGISILIGKMLPFEITFIIQYIIVPYAIMKFFTKIKLDGKMPHKFFFDYLIFKAMPKQMERFRAIKEHNKIKFVTPVVYRMGFVRKAE